MPNGQTNRVLQHLNRVVLQEEIDALTDAELLVRFLSEQDEAAFEAVLHRHGPMVLNVCRRVLRHTHDAEDAFQATFLVLVRKAASIGQRELLANWLYGVAYRTALEAKSSKARRHAKETQVNEMPQPEVRQEDSWQEVEPCLDQELHRLPEKYRIPIVLCDLEGKTQKKAAVLLGWPEGTVSGRLFRAREMLAKRMARYGLAISAGTVAGALTQQSATARLPVPLMVSTVRAVGSVVGKQAMSAGVISAQVAALVEGVLKAMLMTKIKMGITILLVVGILGVGADWITHAAQAQPEAEVAGSDTPKAVPANQKPDGEKPAKDKPSNEAMAAQVKIAEANVEVARANVEVAKAQAEEAGLVYAVAEREEKAQRELYVMLSAQKGVSVSEQAALEAKVAYEKVKGQKEAKKVAHRVALARVKVAEALVKVAEAQVEAARVGS